LSLPETAPAQKASHRLFFRDATIFLGLKYRTAVSYQHQINKIKLHGKPVNFQKTPAHRCIS